MKIPISEIVSKFQEGKCVLLLGPGLSLDQQGAPLQSGLFDYFKNNQLDIEEDIDNLYRCERKSEKTRAYSFLKEYYRRVGAPNEMHRRLAQIPSRLYISINPDMIMKQALEDYGIQHEFKFYVKGQASEEVNNPTGERPLLYNLFGSIDSPQSLVLTHDDLIKYMLSIVRDFRLPQNLRGVLESSEFFIFLGFDFEKWYLRLLLSLFLNEYKLGIASEAERVTQDRLRSFYKKNYELEFVEHNIGDYIKELYDECGRRGVLRQIKAKTEPSIKEQIRVLIKNDELGEALGLLYNSLDKMDEQVFVEKAADKQELLDELDTLDGRLNRTIKILRKGEMREEDARVEINKIIGVIQEIAGEYIV